MIYVSFSTVPDRINNESVYREFLQGLMVQEVNQPYKIIVNIPHKYKNYDTAEIPEWFVKFITQYGEKFIVLRGEVDYGPIVNLIYPLKYLNMDAEDIIIVCDDDHVYHPEMITYHLKKLEKYTENHAVCFRGNRPMDMRTWTEGESVWANLYHTHVHFPTKHDVYLQFPDHWHTVSYRRKFFQDDIFDEKFLSLTWNNDILMAYYAWTHNFYFLCAEYDKETDWRPVNHDGRGSNTFPLSKMLPVTGNGGCDRYRADESQNADVWANEIFATAMKDKEPFKIKETKPSEKPKIIPSSQVVVTLSTVPKRLFGKSGDQYGIQPGLKTILEQSNIEYQVHLNIPYSYQYQRIDIPQWLHDWQEKYPHLKIFRTPDYGPITKLYPTLKRNLSDDTVIITVDDDLLYNDGFILSHLEGIERHPNCALGYAGVTSIEENLVGRYHFASTQPEDIRVRLLEGYKTVSYRKGFFTEEFDQFAFSHWNDDVAISAYLGYKNIKKVVLKCENCVDFTSRVESYPVIGHVPLESNGVGCNVFRTNPDIIKSGDIVATEWYNLGYLER